MSTRFSVRLLAAALSAGLAMAAAVAVRAEPEGTVERIIAQHIPALLDTPGGIAIAVRAGGRSEFFNYGSADGARPITSDVLFNLGSVGKVFDTALMALADLKGELSLDDPVAKTGRAAAGRRHSPDALRQLATHTSGFVLPQDHPPWPTQAFTLPQFIAALNSWSADQEHEPGKQMIYSHASFVLLHLALERRFALPFDQLMTQRVLAPLRLRSTTLPAAAADATLNPRGEIPAALAHRAVQGYSTDGTPTGAPGNLPAITTGWEPRRCTPPRAIWRYSCWPIWASSRASERCRRRCAARSRAFFRSGTTSTKRSPGRCTRAGRPSRQVRRNGQRLGLYRAGEGAEGRHRHSWQSRQHAGLGDRPQSFSKRWHT